MFSVKEPSLQAESATLEDEKSSLEGWCKHMQLLSVNGKMAEDNENHLQGELPGTKEGLQKLYQFQAKNEPQN